MGTQAFMENQFSVVRTATSTIASTIASSDSNTSNLGHPRPIKLTESVPCKKLKLNKDAKTEFDEIVYKTATDIVSTSISESPQSPVTGSSYDQDETQKKLPTRKEIIKKVEEAVLSPREIHKKEIV